MKAKRLTKPAEAPPACEADRKHKYRPGDTGGRCKCRAKYRIGNRNLCQKHAGPAALAVLLGEKT